MQHTADAIDRAALAVSTGLIILGVVVLGFVELLDGAPFGAAPTTNDAGEIVATPMVDPTLRTGLVILGLLVLFAWGLYRMASTSESDLDRRRAEVTAD